MQTDPFLYLYIFVHNYHLSLYVHNSKFTIRNLDN